MTDAQARSISPFVAARATARYLYGQHRVLIVCSLSYLAVLIVLCQSVFFGQSPEEVAGYTIPMFFAGLFWMAVFSYPQADLASPHSGFPRHLLTLPVSTQQLVLWPMLLGSVALASGWLIMALLIWRPVGLRLPLFWPAAMFSAALACLQAILWSPAGLPFVRILSSVVVVSVVVAFGLVSTSLGVTPLLIGVIYVALMPVAYFVAVSGLGRARRGDSPQWHAPMVRLVNRLRPRYEPPAFPSARDALLWFEWRSHGLMLVLVLASTAMLLGLPAIWVRDEVPLGVGAIQVNAVVKYQWVLLLFPAFFSVIRVGGRADPLLFTRPLSSVQIVLARFRAAWRDVVRSVGAALAVLFLWTLVPATDGEVRAPLLWLLLPYVTWGRAAALAVAVALFCCWLWKIRVQGLFIELAGRRWLTMTFILTVMAGLIGAGVAIPELWRTRPGMFKRAMEFIPHVLAVAVALKAIAATKILRALWRRRVINASQLDLILSGWLLITAMVAAVISSAIPADRLSLTAKVLLAVHLVPLARLLAAPLSVELNRHR